MSTLSQSLPDREKTASSAIGAEELSTAPLLHERWFRLTVSGLSRALNTAWVYLRRQGSGLGLLQGRQRRLRVCETVSLGEKRFVSILEVDGQAFLLGGSSAGVALLATLAPDPIEEKFARVLHESFARGEAS